MVAIVVLHMRPLYMSSAVVCSLHFYYCELCGCEILVYVSLYRKCRWRLIQHHGLWWILLLLYSHLVHTSMSILDCPMLRDPSDQTVRPVRFLQVHV